MKTPRIKTLAKTLKIMLIIILIIGILADIIGSFYLYEIGIARNSKEFLAETEDVQASVEIMMSTQSEEIDYEWFYQQEFEQVQITSYDGLVLNGYFLEAETPTNKTAILVHGYSSWAEGMGVYAKFYYENLGYNILMPDARGHGSSEGDYIGLGWHDRKDYVKWIDYVIERKGTSSEIVLHGVSMGGAAVLMTSGEELPDNVKAIISDSAYTSAKDELAYMLTRLYHLPSFPLLQSTSLLTKIRAGFFFGEASALKQVKKANKPILFIHGGNDTIVPVEMVYKLYENCGSEKELFVVAGAAHGTAYNVDPEGYERQITEFLNKYVGK